MEIKSAKVLEYVSRGGKEVRMLTGNVVLKQKDMILHCDSAYQNITANTIEAYGNIHIEQGDSIDLYGKRLDYDATRKFAVISDDVRLMDREMELRTEKLYYDVGLSQGYYLDSGIIYSDENTLTSDRGYYYSTSQDLYFRHNVKLVNPRYTMNCDTLRYHIPTKVAYFYGPTHILSDSNALYCENGWYNTETDRARFGQNASLKSGAQELYGDSLFYDRNRGLGRAEGNITLLDTVEKFRIKGNYAKHFEYSEETFITKKVLVVKPFEKDTFFMTSDTLWAAYETDSVKTVDSLAVPDSLVRYRVLRGYYDARSFSTDFQTACDSLVYSFRDSVIDLYHLPVLWFDKFQVTAEHIKIFTRNNNVQRLEMTKDAFIISPEDSIRYNQIKGKDMTAWFRNNEMYQVDVYGNGQSIYFVKDEKDKYIGVNKIESSDIRIGIDSNQVSQITFLKKPSGDMNPLMQVAAADLKLKGFDWREELRPLSVRSLVGEDYREDSTMGSIPPETKEKELKEKEEKLEQPSTQNANPLLKFRKGRKMQRESLEKTEEEEENASEEEVKEE